MGRRHRMSDTARLEEDLERLVLINAARRQGVPNLTPKRAKACSRVGASIKCQYPPDEDADMK